MATAEQYAKWIVENQDKQGTPEFDTVAKAYKVARGMAQQAEIPTSETKQPETAELSLQEQANLQPDVPMLDESGNIVPTTVGVVPAQETTLGEDIVGAGETALTLATGATGGTGGMIVGALKQLATEIAQGNYGSKEAADRVEKEALRMAEQFTYAPRTEAGQEMVAETGEALAPLQALGGLTGELQAVSQAAKPVAQRGIVEPLNQVGEEIKTGAAATGQMLGAKSGAPQPQTGIVPAVSPVTEPKPTVRRLKEDPANVENAEYMLKGDKAVKDDLASEALKQGFRKGTIASVKAASKEDKYNMLKMIGILKRGRENEDFRAENRPTDVVGESLQKRIKFINDEKNKAGEAVEASAKALPKNVNYQGSINTFLDDLARNDINVFQDGKVFKANLDGSVFEGNAKVEDILNKTLKRLSDTQNPDGYRVHTAKAFIDGMVDYGGSLEGRIGQLDRILKNLRRNLNNDLRAVSKEYADANDKYSAAMGALKGFQKAVGTTTDLESRNADKSLGTASRRLLSNAQAREKMITALQDVDKFADKYGLKLSDNVTKKVAFANELDRMFGPVADTSHAGEVAKGVQTGSRAARGGLVDIAIEAGAKGAEKLRGINEENALKSIEQLLKRDLKLK